APGSLGGPLDGAASTGRLETMWLLLEARADIEHRGVFGETPLSVACAMGKLDAAKILVAEGANMEAERLGGQTPLWAACQHGRASVIRMLLKARAHIDARDDLGMTPLATACHWGRPRAVRLLLAAGAKKELADRFGTTPLGTACRCGQLHLVRMLLEVSDLDPQVVAQTAEKRGGAATAIRAALSQLGSRSNGQLATIAVLEAWENSHDVTSSHMKMLGYRCTEGNKVYKSMKREEISGKYHAVVASLAAAYVTGLKAMDTKLMKRRAEDKMKPKALLLDNQERPPAKKTADAEFQQSSDAFRQQLAEQLATLPNQDAMIESMVEAVTTAYPEADAALIASLTALAGRRGLRGAVPSGLIALASGHLANLARAAPSRAAAALVLESTSLP
ncbi:mask, partial [Symbiodinium sp. KB8]